MKSFACLARNIRLATLLASISLPSSIAFGAESPEIADGRPWMEPEIGISVTPPIGWQIQPNHLGKTLVLQPVRKQEKIKDYSKPIYNPNIAVAVLHEARPIDETEAQILRKKLLIDFGQASGVYDFQVLEHRFIDYREKADGILLYTAFLLNGFPMSQMHIFLSGSKNSALLTYTDLTDSFQSNEAAMTEAWNAMVSAELKGTAPKRYKDVIYAGSALGLILASGFLLLLLRRRSAHKKYEVEEEKLYSDDAAKPERFPSVTGMASFAARTSAQKESRDVTDVWNPAISQVSTTLPHPRKKLAKSAVESAW